MHAVHDSQAPDIRPGMAQADVMSVILAVIIFACRPMAADSERLVMHSSWAATAFRVSSAVTHGGAAQVQGRAHGGCEGLCGAVPLLQLAAGLPACAARHGGRRRRERHLQPALCAALHQRAALPHSQPRIHGEARA